MKVLAAAGVDVAAPVTELLNSKSMADPHTAKVIFQPSGKRGDFPLGTPVLDAARQLGVQIESVCGGRGICGKCQIEVSEGAFSKFGVTSHPDHLSPFGPIEARYDEKRGLAKGRRLSCSAKIDGDLVVDVPQASIVAGQTIRKDANTIGMIRNPAVRPYYVELSAPDLEHPHGDADRLRDALSDQFAIDGLVVPFPLLSTIQHVLASADHKATLIVFHGPNTPHLQAILPGYQDTVFGLAVDIGSTTIAAHLVDLMSGEIVASAGRANPQIRFGEDLMSRVSYIMMNDGGLERLTKAVRQAINELIGELSARSGVERSSVFDSVFVANPVMHHIFFALDPTPLGQAPFNPAISSEINCLAADIGIDLADGARVYGLPIVAGHVGADAAAMVLAQQPQKQNKPVLLVDVGTNAEIVLWDGKQMFAASSPTGPALEGAEISSGQRAAPGAIERIRIDRETLEPRYRVIGSELWSDEEDFADSVSDTGVAGLCGSAIIEIVGEMLLAGIVNPVGVIRAPQTDAEQARIVQNGRTFSYVISESNPRLEIKQTDIRAIQLAKAALYAGIKLLLDHAGLERIDDIRLAGAFGTYIDPAYAMLLGLVPDCNETGITSIGNAAGQGALIALLNRDARQGISQTVAQITRIETALEPKFQEHFVQAMGVPNSTDPFLLTREHFGLAPLAKNSDSDGGRRRRRRRS